MGVPVRILDSGRQTGSTHPCRRRRKRVACDVFARFLARNSIARHGGTVETRKQTFMRSARLAHVTRSVSEELAPQTQTSVNRADDRRSPAPR